MDYLIYKDEKKPALGQCVDIDGSDITIIPEKDRHIAEETKHIRMSEVWANLGKSPKGGVVHGVRVEPYVRTIRSNRWGDIHVFRNLSKKEAKILRDSLDEVYDLLDEQGLTGFLPIELEIRGTVKRGPSYMTGLYYPRKDIDKMVIMVPDMEDETMIRETIAHESGHGVSFRVMNHDVKAKWVKEYGNCVNLSSYSKKDIKAMYDLLLEYDGVNAALRELSEESDRNLMRGCLRHLAREWKMTRSDITHLVRAGMMDKDMWPQHPMDLRSHMKVLITEYSMKNSEEFLCRGVQNPPPQVRSASEANQEPDEGDHRNKEWVMDGTVWTILGIALGILLIAGPAVISYSIGFQDGSKEAREFLLPKLSSSTLDRSSRLANNEGGVWIIGGDIYVLDKKANMIRVYDRDTGREDPNKSFSLKKKRSKDLKDMATAAIKEGRCTPNTNRAMT